MEAIYKIYDLRKYYPNFVGMNSTVVVSDLTEEELLLHCPELIRKQPFVLLTKTKWSEKKEESGTGGRSAAGNRSRG